jgi:hypothetical protein
LFKRWISLISRFMRFGGRMTGLSVTVSGQEYEAINNPLTKFRRAHCLKGPRGETRCHPTLTAKKQSYTMSRRLCGASRGRHGCSS